jgi:outer membrane beta-barrel protein
MTTPDLKTLFAALVLAVPQLARAAEAATQDAPTLLAAAPVKDDDEDDEPPVTPAKPAETKPAPVAEGAVTTGGAAATTAEEQKLVSGAPLYNPNVAVHIVEQKAFSDRMRLEFILYPATVQVNGKFTQHFGSSLNLLWHVQENFGFWVGGFYNWVATESGFNAELIDKTRSEAQAATSLLSVWGAMGGVEVTPLYGKFALFDSVLAHFSLVLNGGAGAGGTKHQLKPENATGPATFGETGTKFLGEVGGGFRLQLGKYVALRLEIKDIIYTARVEAVEGCNGEDLRAMDAVIRGGRPVTDASVAPACRIERFDGINPDTNQRNSTDVPLAYNLVRTPSSDVLNNVGLYLGIAVVIP